MKQKATIDGEKIFAYYVVSKGPVSRIYKEPLKLNSKIDKQMHEETFY